MNVENGFVDGLVRFSDIASIFKKRFKYTKVLTNQSAEIVIPESEHRKGRFPLVSFLDSTVLSYVPVVFTLNEKGDVIIAATGESPYSVTVIII